LARHHLSRVGTDTVTAEELHRGLADAFSLEQVKSHLSMMSDNGDVTVSRLNNKQMYTFQI